METTFKVVFAFGVILFCLVIIGLFLLFIKIMLLFTDHIQLMGILMSSAN